MRSAVYPGKLTYPTTNNFSLEVLNLQKNRIEAIQFKKHPKVQTLNLAENKISTLDALFGVIGLKGALKAIYLNGNPVVKKSVAEFKLVEDEEGTLNIKSAFTASVGLSGVRSGWNAD